VIELTVIGTPAPQGSKTRTRFGVREDNPRTKPWRATVAAEAAVAHRGPLVDQPVEVDALFVFPRPKSHYRTGRNAHLLKDTAPAWCATKPDADKLARAVGDALSGVLLRDDNLIVEWRIRKVYGSPARCELRIAAADNIDQEVAA
jgi:Holliday junction resolvase RusA-like endonuclease